MQKLYLDCDGVILDTVSKGVYDNLKKLGIVTAHDTGLYFSKLNWDEYIEKCGQIDNAIDKIKELCNYFDIEILTHVNSDNSIRFTLPSILPFSSSIVFNSASFCARLCSLCLIFSPSGLILSAVCSESSA